jgi:hypothetical protein
MFRGVLLHIIRVIKRLVVDRIPPTASQHKAESCQHLVNTTRDYNNCCLYTADPPDDGQEDCSKHVEVNY